jgi:hypothetical protein
VIEVLQHHIDVGIGGFEFGDRGFESGERRRIEIGVVFQCALLGHSLRCHQGKCSRAKKRGFA